MNVPSYSFEEINPRVIFTFESVGDKNTIQKFIVYDLIKPDDMTYNLALLDIDKDGNFSDLSISNNGDMESVLSTVANTIDVFLKKYPKAKILFKGSSPSRIRLYRMAISKYIVHFEQKFITLGYLTESADEVPELFVKNQPYLAFLIILKPQSK